MMAGVFCTYNDLSVLAPGGHLLAAHLLGVLLPLHLRVILVEEVGGGEGGGEVRREEGRWRKVRR